MFLLFVMSHVFCAKLRKMMTKTQTKKVFHACQRRLQTPTPSFPSTQIYILNEDNNKLCPEQVVQVPPF